MDTDKLAVEIKEYFEKASDSYEKVKVAVSFDERNKSCTVSLNQMYRGIGALASFKNLSWLSKKLGTENINLENEYYSAGCESCDWGSSDSVDIVCREVSL